VGLAQAILHIEVVILESDVGLDPVGRARCATLFWSKRDGKTVMFPRTFSRAEMLCDRVGVIAGGKLAGLAPGTL